MIQILFNFFSVLFGLSFGKEIREFYAIKESGENVSVSDEYLIQTVHCISKPSALRACVSQENCISYIFNKDKRFCVLFRNTASAMSARVFEEHWFYYNVYESSCPEYDGFSYDVETGFCIKPYTMKSTYDQAVSHCGKDRATLARIDSDDKWQFVTQNLATVAFSLFYVQGRYKNGLFVYDDDDEIKFIKWASLPPETHDINRLILSKDDGYKWHAVKESSFNGFICQKFVRTSFD